jgi:hypothetical protein
MKWEPKPRTVVSTVERRKVMKIVRPFLPAVERWNIELPRLRAVLESPYASGFEKSCVVVAVEEMIAQLATMQSEFLSATYEVARHSRVTDVRGSMKRLSDQLAALREEADAADAQSRTPFPLVGALRPDPSAGSLLNGVLECQKART